MSMIDEINRDREAGRGNRWKLLDTLSSATVMDGTAEVLSYRYSPSKQNRANARRIARVPDLEAALIAAEELADALYQERNMVCQDMGMQADCAARVDATLAAYRAATGAA